MKKVITFMALVVLVFQFGNAQETLQKVLDKHNDHSIPYINVEELAKDTNVVLLDSREPKEFKTSHLNNAVLVGYDHFNIKNVTKTVKDKNQKIVVYCSLGIRSETIAKKIKDAGYTNVYNLHGGIFEWSNNEKPLVNSKGKETKKVHTFNKDWSQWLLKGEKIYEE
ncbi:Rhodanese-related sulfurtransferase [Lutibacter oricola]|uniref:Rhodanese-related sulfurtransferase n=1 Tax=Lutibacter oricola TaxID=762486 RepID=A0A1H2ZDQ2_9FLAO|nr:rhodanese-like domain-containing protein [Lutibacter oricola]SDX15511.1 Rhodanese-related sulfurtransferase [Lutibacter oricola]